MNIQTCIINHLSAYEENTGPFSSYLQRLNMMCFFPNIIASRLLSALFSWDSKPNKNVFISMKESAKRSTACICPLLPPSQCTQASTHRQTACITFSSPVSLLYTTQYSPQIREPVNPRPLPSPQVLVKTLKS